MYVVTGILFVVPCTLLFLAGRNLSGTNGTIPPWRRYFSMVAIFVAGVSTLIHVVWNVSWLRSGGSPHGMGAGHGIWQPLGPILVWTFLISIALSLFGKGKVRMLLVGWSVSMYAVFELIYMLQLD